MEHKGWYQLPEHFRNQIKQGDWINLPNKKRRPLIAKLTRLSGDAKQVSVAAARASLGDSSVHPFASRSTLVPFPLFFNALRHAPFAA